VITSGRSLSKASVIESASAGGRASGASTGAIRLSITPAASGRSDGGIAEIPAPAKNVTSPRRIAARQYRRSMFHSCIIKSNPRIMVFPISVPN
jgi:hypothetical protein